MTAAQRAPRGDAGPTEGELHPAGDWVGTRLPRKEDPRLLRGRGRFVDDIERAGLLHACFVRSPHASAEIAGLDLTRTREAAGVVAALTGEDLGSPGLTAILQREEFTPTRMPILAQRRVRYVGEPLAIVLAGDPYLAEDGAELAQADYRVRSAVSSAAAATATDAPRVHEELIGNTFLDFSPFTDPGIDEVFASAPCVVTVRTHTGRQNAMPLEPRGCLAEWVDRDEQLVLHVSTQVPHQVRTAVARCLGLAESAVRVIAGDVGGGFGMKCVVGREEIAVAAAALRLRRGVKWIEDRRDGLIASVHGREQSYLARAAFDEQGQILALDAQIDCDVGAYSVFPFTSGVEPLMAATELPGVYRVPRYRVRSRGIATNKAPTAPYRGVSRPQIVLVMERLMERAAEELGIDSLALRRINLIDT
ncbi:MAG: xanthine dehydrogenase family protein molybdopterin-binding subunit, partial [Sciscionella sp.]